ncbi:hypothetical protein [uncultured Hymenobacter sp.]|uniref:hypothetical protein n=1 Tax=uncultured Hymenobacter sp. TaxID=170016 RepID=UPI0035CB70D4
MKLALALLLNAALLALVLPWLRREWRAAPRPLRRVLLPALALRLLVGGLASLRLTYDAYLMSKLGHALNQLLWDFPVWAAQTLRGDSYQLGGWDIVYNGANRSLLFASNSFFFSKILLFVNIASGGLDWLNGVYLSLFVFAGSWVLVRTLAGVLPATPAGAGAVAFLLWPSVVGFASGITKETLVLGSGAWLLALVVRGLYGAPGLATVEPGRFGRTLGWTGGVGILLLALLHFKMRYFFAVPLLAGLAGLALIRLGQRLGLAQSRLSQVGLLLAVLAVGAGVGPALSPVFRLNKFTGQLIKIYGHHLSTSRDKPHFEYPALRPTGESALRHAPQAVWNCLTRPWLGESAARPYVAAGLDNLALLTLLALAAAAAWRGRAGRLPFALGLVLALHCLLLAFLIGLSTPNLGSLHRYRSGLLPYLLLLLLQNDYAARLLRRAGLGSGPAPPANEPGLEGAARAHSRPQAGLEAVSLPS